MSHVLLEVENLNVGCVHSEVLGEYLFYLKNRMHPPSVHFGWYFFKHDSVPSSCTALCSNFDYRERHLSFGLTKGLTLWSVSCQGVNVGVSSLFLVLAKKQLT